MSITINGVEEKKQSLSPQSLQNPEKPVAKYQPTPQRNHTTMSVNLDPQKTCLLCCEEPRQPLFSLSICQHESCRACLKKWTEKAEAAGYRSCPSCPFCRVEMTEQDTKAILGRSFRADTREQQSSQPDDEMDDLTREWLQEQTTPCPNCGAFIQKEEGTCDMMECLCGHRFCYRCGSPGAQCGCTPGNHIFWDNTNDRLASLEVSRQAARDDETGQLNLWRHIQWRRGRPIREGRACRVANNLMERDELDESIWRAPWLFCSSRQASIRMLDSVMNADNKRRERSEAREQLKREEQEAEDELFSARWLFYSEQVGIWMLGQQHQRERRCIYRVGGTDPLWKAEWDHNRARIRKRMLRRAGFAARPSLARSSSSFDSLKRYRNRLVR